MNQEIHPGPWEPYSDEVAHYSYVRCLEQDSLYEVVRVSHEKDSRTAEFLHQVIFMKEYGEAELSKILAEFGYDSLEAFARETGRAGTAPMCKARRSGDCAAEAKLPIDYMTLAGLMAGHFTGRRMNICRAERLADSIVKGQDTPNPFCISRPFAGQSVTIPLTSAEVDAIYSARASQIQMDELCDEIRDLDKDDPCFEGHAQEELLNNSRFIDAVQARWDRYNGNGGDEAENLREAIMVTIHELFQNDGQKSRIGTTYNKILYVPESVLQTIREYLDAQSESEYQGEDNTIIYTAKFPDGREMDIKCCGCQEESSWTEAVLFDEKGYQLTYTDVGEKFEGLWELEYDGIHYCVDVKPERNNSKMED